MADSSDSDDDVPLSQMLAKEDSKGAAAPPPAPAPAPTAKPAAPAVETKKEEGGEAGVPPGEKRKADAEEPPAKKPKPVDSAAAGGSSSGDGGAGDKAANGHKPAEPPKPAAPKPAAPKPAPPKPAAAAPVKKKRIMDSDDDSSSDDEPPAAKKPAAAKPAAESSSSKVGSSSGAPSSSAKPAEKPAAKPAVKPEPKTEATKAAPPPKPAPPKAAPAKVSATASSSSSKAKPPPKKKPVESESDSDSDSDDEDEAGPSGKATDEKWYEKGTDKVEWKKGGEKWKTLEWSGVLFPPLYEAHGVPFRYDGAVVPLTEEQEEVATMYASMLTTTYAKEAVFNQNFMASWRPLLQKTPETKHVKDLTKCDFAAIKQHVDDLSAKKKEMSSDEKKAAKIEKDAIEEPFIHAIVDGRKEKLGNFRVEPPGLFRGRGAHPKMGKLKARIYPEDITLNMSKKAKVPPVPDLGDGKKHEWGAVVHKNTVTWLAKWKDSINGEDKCVWLAANSSWKGQSDKAKYEKARELKKHIAKVRQDYTQGMQSGNLDAQQRSVAVYLIDRLALRVGGEKDKDEEADTVGCCSLRVEHVKLDVPENELHLNFLGKDSIEYDNSNEINPRAYSLIRKFMKNKPGEAQLFDKVEPSDLNEYFKSVMEGLSAKVFRTYNASITLCQELGKTDEMVTAAQRQRETEVVALCNYYTIANKQVAILCNHQKAASANFGDQMAKMDENINKVKAELKEAKKAKAPKAEGLQKRLDKLEAARRTKDETKNVSLGTSKINYNDPRITIAWCKAHEVPIQKQFPKTLLAKFAWAMNVEPTYRF